MPLQAKLCQSPNKLEESHPLKQVKSKFNFSFGDAKFSCASRAS